MKRSTAFHCATIVVCTGILQLAYADDFQTTVQASSEHENGEEACIQAYEQAQSEAIEQIQEHFDLGDTANIRIKLISEKETKTTRPDQKTICVFEGLWQGETVQAPQSLIGTEQYIDGQYSGSCLDTSNGDICWQRIIRQAEEDLYAQLSRTYTDMPSFGLRYVDFEGRQRDEYRQKRLEMTADGRFYFEVTDASQNTDAYISITRKNSTQVPPKTRETPPPAPVKPEPKAEPSKPDLIDVTLFYTWDGNDSALHNDLAISSDRWGIGLWTNNRIGVAAFKGSDRLGIGAENGLVKNASGRYETTGVGMGYRLWKNRGITLENMLYYVDAQPYQALVAPDCDSCDATQFRSDNYLQATVNLKTNSQGINVGWMFTWKILENEANLDTLSSGFYLELQL